MIEKFIEGTDDQYSIREDGVVIKHYTIFKRLKKVYKDSILEGSKNKEGKVDQFNIKNKYYGKNALMIKYFGIKSCRGKNCSNHLTKLRAMYCSDCKKLSRDNFNERYKETRRLVRIKKLEKDVQLITKKYVADLLKIKMSELPHELYEHHRNLLLFKRKLSKEFNVSIYKFNN
jgi:hypothetical protein